MANIYLNYLQNALLTALAVKGVLTMKDCAAVSAGALDELRKMRPTHQGKEMHAAALQTLTTLAQGWETQAKGN